MTWYKDKLWINKIMIYKKMIYNCINNKVKLKEKHLLLWKKNKKKRKNILFGNYQEVKRNGFYQV